jgi:hypothetical protein
VRQDVRTASLALLAGAIGVVGAIYTARGLALNRASQLTDRFTKAIEQLGHKELTVRLGGIYALERIARDSRQDHPQVVEVLTAYVRERALVNRGVADSELARPETDVQAVLTVLGRRKVSHEMEPPPWLDLALTNLDGASLFEARFRRAGLRGASLRDAYLIRADLRRTSVRQTSAGPHSVKRASAARISDTPTSARLISPTRTSGMLGTTTQRTGRTGLIPEAPARGLRTPASNGTRTNDGLACSSVA